MDDEERPGGGGRRGLVGEHLAERRLVVMKDVDRMLMVVRVQLAMLQRFFEGRLSGLAGSEGHGEANSKVWFPACLFFKRYLTISGTAIDPMPRSTTIAGPTTARRTGSFVKYRTRPSALDESADSIR